MKNFLCLCFFLIITGVITTYVNAAELLNPTTPLITKPSVIVPDNLIIPDKEEETTACKIYEEIIMEGMPREVGDQKALSALLQVKPENWVQNIQVEKLLETLGESGKLEGRFFEDTAGIVRSETSMFKLNLARGEFRYINNTREFDLAKDPVKAIGNEKGLPIIENLLKLLGVPENETGRLRGVILMGTTGPVASKPIIELKSFDENTIEVETTFFGTRSINDLPVVNSNFTAGLDNKGEISRFNLKWPVLKIDPSLLKGEAEVLSKAQVAESIMETMMNHQGCEKPEVFKMHIAYFPSLMEVQDEDKDKNEVIPLMFSPRLMVYYRTGNQEEGGEILDFPLFKQ